MTDFTFPRDNQFTGPLVRYARVVLGTDARGNTRPFADYCDAAHCRTGLPATVEVTEYTEEGDSETSFYCSECWR